MDDYEIIDAENLVVCVDFEEVPWYTPPQSPIEKEKLKELSIAINKALDSPKNPNKQPVEAELKTAIPAKKKKVHTTF